MNARRSPGERRENSVRKLASDPPFVIVTFSAVASGYHAATLAARLERTLGQRVAERGEQEGLGVGRGAQELADRHGEHADSERS